MRLNKSKLLLPLDPPNPSLSCSVPENGCDRRENETLDDRKVAGEMLMFLTLCVLLKDSRFLR